MDLHQLDLGSLKGLQYCWHPVIKEPKLDTSIYSLMMKLKCRMNQSGSWWFEQNLRPREIPLIFPVSLFISDVMLRGISTYHGAINFFRSVRRTNIQNRQHDVTIYSQER